MMRVRLLLAWMVLAAILCGCGEKVEEERITPPSGTTDGNRQKAGIAQPAPIPELPSSPRPSRAMKPHAGKNAESIHRASLPPKTERPDRAITAVPPALPSAGDNEPAEVVPPPNPSPSEEPVQVMAEQVVVEKVVEEQKQPQRSLPPTDIAQVVATRPSPIVVNCPPDIENPALCPKDKSGPPELASPVPKTLPEPIEPSLYSDVPLSDPIRKAGGTRYPFVLEGAADVRFELEGPTERIVQLALIDAKKGSEIAYVAGSAPRILTSLNLPAGAYAVNVSLPDGKSGFELFQARLSKREIGGPDTSLHDDTPAKANLLSSGEKRHHAIQPAEDIDWFTFSLMTAADVQIDFDAGNITRSLRMALYERDGKTRLAYVVGAPSRKLSYRNLPAGTYFVEISDHGRDQAVGAYTISLATAETGQGIDHADDDRPGTATSLLPGRQEERAISPLGDVDWFTFALVRPAEVNFAVTGPVSQGGIQAALFREKKTEALAHFSGPFPRTMNCRFLPAGVYYVRISGIGDRQLIGAYAASLQVRELDPEAAAKLALTYSEPAERSSMLRGLEAVLRKVGDFFAGCREALKGLTSVG